MNASEYLSVCANASDSSVTSEVWSVQDWTSGMVTAVFLLLFQVIGLPCNLLVIVTIVKQKLYTQPTIILLLILAITDVLVLLLHHSLLIPTGFRGEFIFGKSDRVRCSMCSLGFLSILLFINVIFTISLMSIDRFLFIYKPLHYASYVTKWRTVAAVILTWLIATVLSIIPFAGFGDIIFRRESIVCSLDPSLDHSKYPILVVAVAILSIIPIIICNLCICCIVQKNIQAIYKVRQTMELSNNTTSGHSDDHRSVKKKRLEKQLHLYKVFGTLLCYDIITWLPQIAVFLTRFSGTPVPAGVVAAAQIFFFSQSTIHPIIETTLLKEVREPLKAMLFCSCVAVKAKWSADKRSATINISIDSNLDSSNRYHNYIAISGSAVLFHDPQERTIHTEGKKESSFDMASATV